ncbi:hypothetical protein [Bacillus infantis]|uniref:hypothetical protein n=1 Tax=Bacillus infantis TaxID=324767 RepID=UPI003CF0B16B
MNLGEAKKKAISLILEYTNDGGLIGDIENADYLTVMNRFANDAQMEIAKKVGIPASMIILQPGVQVNGYQRYPLPADFMALRSVSRNDCAFHDYKVQNGQIWLRTRYDGSFELFYEKVPTLIDPNTPDSYEFEVDLHTQHLIPYYLGGLVMAEEKEGVSARLLNIYYEMLANLKDYKTQIPSTIHSVDGW